MGDMRSDADIFQERIERDIVAFGNFSATDMINHSTHQDEFTHLEPGLFDQQKKKIKHSTLKEAQKSA